MRESRFHTIIYQMSGLLLKNLMGATLLVRGMAHFKSVLVFAGAIGLLMFASCSVLNVAEPATPAVIGLPDAKPAPNPEPVAPIDGVLEIGTGERPTLSVHTFYDADKNDKRDPEEGALGLAGLRLTPVREGPNGPEKTGPGRLVRTTKDGLLLARVPAGMYSLEYANIISAGQDPNAAQWASAEAVLTLSQDQSLDLPAFCQVEARIQPGPVGVCAPEFDLKPRAFLAVVPEEVQVGEKATLRFRADDESSVTLEPFGTVESFRESDFFERIIKPTLTTTYVLRAKNAFGTREVRATVTVKP
jgi:hypothetical protein